MKIIFIHKYCLDHNSIIVNCLCKVNSEVFSIKETPLNTDLIGFTYFNNDSEILLKRLRKEYPQNQIIVGGIGVYQNYHNIFRYADYCYFGDAFVFSEKSILSKKNLGNIVSYNNIIRYEKLPFVKHTSSRFEFITEKGCPNKCEFCQISHVQDFSIINNDYFKRVISEFDKKYKNLNLSFLNSDGLINYKNCDFLNSLPNNRYYAASVPVKMYLKKYEIFGKQNNIKFGVELPSEELRFKHLPAIKQITNNELIECISTKSINIMTFFLIYNYVGVDNKDYLDLFNVIKYKKTNVNLRTSFTTLQISAYTPLAIRLKEHLEQIINNYDFRDVKEIQMYKNVSHVRVLPAKCNKNALYDYFRTFLTYNYDILNPDNFDNAKDYYCAMTKKYNKNLIDIMYDNCKNMTKTKNEIKTININ